MADMLRARAWDELLRVLPADWAVARPAWRDDDRLWPAHARCLPCPRRDWQAVRESYGETEVSALRSLARQFQISVA